MDNVNHPSHYTAGGIEVIEFLKAKLTREEYRGFLKGNVIKYLSRAGLKGAETQDYHKALWYLNRLCDDCTIEYHSMQIPEGDDEE